MSAPDTNIDKQVRHHRGPLFGIAVVTGAVAILFTVFLMWTSYQSDTEAPAEPITATTISE